MTGTELTRTIRTTPGIGSLPILMLTSSGNGRQAAIDAGVDGFVTKPVREARLLQEIAKGLAPRQGKPPAESAPATAPHVEPAEGPRLLVAEDNIVNQRVAVALLQKRGFRVDVAADGREAVEMSKRSDYQAIFMDCQMPELDGYEATAEIRRREGTGQHVPIVAMTASTMAGDRERCLAAGMDDYISKPIRNDVLDGLVAKLPTRGPGFEATLVGEADEHEADPGAATGTSSPAKGIGRPG